MIVGHLVWWCLIMISTMSAIFAKVFNRCDLAKLLDRDFHLPRKEIAIWVCIAQRQSGFNSAAITYDNDGTAYHGLFQISDKYWCRASVHASGSNVCEIDCARLRNDNLSDDYQCIQRIYDEHRRISGDGYMAWAAYKNSCRNVRESSIEECFSASDRKQTKKVIVSSQTNKVYQKCELARELRYIHAMPRDQIGTWTCIAKHESNFNTSAIGRLNGDGSTDHGLFQISDLYWCSPPGKGWACGVTCAQLKDDDITDDVACAKIIYEEHQRLSGDGFNAWTVYPSFCKGRSETYANECFKNDDEKDNSVVVSPPKHHPAITAPPLPMVLRDVNKYVSAPVAKGKIYKRCELAQELRFRHKIPIEQIATWVCIAQHESNFNTSAIGRLNADGSEDHGLFQISDIYWCSPPGKGWVCGVPCSAFEDSDITDDVSCMRKIFDEHQRISGDGFSAWAVYQPYCQNQKNRVDNCFDTVDEDNTVIPSTLPHKPGVTAPAGPPSSRPKAVGKGKIYTRCELATELRHKHRIPLEQIATWVCIAKFESSFNTSAVGHLNADGSGDHGLFQISDIYWCSPPGKGLVCGLTCAELEDSDITDDIECAQKIFDEHTRLSGDGFTAWAVYNPHCRGKSKNYIADCFANENEITEPNRKKSVVESDSMVSKIYDRCELAAELLHRHNIPMEQIATWVCIAFHESAFNTSAVTSGESAEHGLFQISDIYWCSPPGKGCGLTCAELEDSDISDDVSCVQTIYEEHQRLSDDGWNAWQVYQPYCRNSPDHFIEGCFDDVVAEKPNTDLVTIPKGKVYSRCELAHELRDKHGIPMEQIATWVCIAKHESSFNTSAIGRLNTDGSGDHGLFQISDIYWCSPPGMGWVCGLSCSKLEDSDISDDVECMKQIYDEHKRISGNGFNAWAVYKPYCKSRADRYIAGCFEGDTTTIVPSATTSATTTVTPAVRSTVKTVSNSKFDAKLRNLQPIAKIYERCELAKALRFQYNVPMNQIANWVCIAKYQSQFNTSAVRKYQDGFSHYGLFQIGSRYWCSPPGFGCDIPCDRFRDTNIADDIMCAQQIYDAHELIDGDGFSAWAAYKEFCKDRSKYFVTDCWDGSAENGLKKSIFNQKPTAKSTTKVTTTPKTFMTTTPLSTVKQTATTSKRTLKTLTSTKNSPPKATSLPQRSSTKNLFTTKSQYFTTTEKLKEFPTLSTTARLTTKIFTAATTQPTTEIDYDTVGHLPIKLPGKRVYRNLYDFYLNGFTMSPKVSTYQWPSFNTTQQRTANLVDEDVSRKSATTPIRVNNNYRDATKMTRRTNVTTKILPITPVFIQKYINNDNDNYSKLLRVSKMPTVTTQPTATFTVNNALNKKPSSSPVIKHSPTTRPTTLSSSIAKTNNKTYSSAFDHYFNLFKH